MILELAVPSGNCFLTSYDPGTELRKCHVLGSNRTVWPTLNLCMVLLRYTGGRALLALSHRRLRTRPVAGDQIECALAERIANELIRSKNLRSSGNNLILTTLILAGIA
jgi:hypothetical protein